MSTLQLGLVILGGVILAVVVAYNTWNNRRNAPKRALASDDLPSVAPPEGQTPSIDRFEPSLDDPLGSPAVHRASAHRPDHRPDLGASWDDDLPHPHPQAQAHDSRWQPDDAHLQAQADFHADLQANLDAHSQAHAASDPDTDLHTASGPLHPAPAVSATRSHPGAERTVALDPQIDAMASLLVDNLVSGEAAIAAMPPTRRVGHKPFAIEGYNATLKQWEYPQAGQRYMAFQAGVQLANRTGALSQIEFSEFVMKTQAFADAVNAAPEFPDMQHEVARARALDEFASAHDAQLSFTLRARQAAWSPGYVQQCAARLGFAPGPVPGHLVLHSSSGSSQPPLLALEFDSHAALADDPELSALCEVELVLDVPQVDRREQPFARLREIATALCQSMDGVLCDQNGLPLPIMAMDAIVHDLEQLYDKLDAQNLSAGSPLARRLFG